MKQDTIDGKAVFKSRNKKIIKSYSMKSYPPTENTPESIVRDTEEIFHRSKFYALTSGGKDSMGVCHWLAEHDKLAGAVHIDTTLEVPMTREFIEDECQERGYDLTVIQPSPIYTYDAHVLQYGFPEPEFHRIIMGKLKFKTMRDFALTKDRYNHVLASGIHEGESAQRNMNYLYPIQSDGALWFTCPFFYKTTEEIYKYKIENNLKTTPAHDIFGHSADCMCGSYSSHRDKELLKEYAPKLVERFEWLEEGIQKFGTAHAKRYPTWGGHGKMSELDKQRAIDGFYADNPDLESSKDFEKTICKSCDNFADLVSFVGDGSQ